MRLQVTVYDSSNLSKTCTVNCDVEPSFLACGPKAVALGLNNHCWFFSATDGKMLQPIHYVGSVESIHLNDSHVASLVDGKVYLHLVSPNLKKSLEQKIINSITA